MFSSCTRRIDYVSGGNAHVGLHGSPFEAAALPFEPVELGALPTLFRPEGLDVDALFGALPEDTLIVDVAQPAGTKATHGGTDDALNKRQLNEIVRRIV